MILMNIINIFGIIFNLLGTILLYIGFQIEKTKAEEEGTEFYLEDKLPIVLKYENSFLRNAGWFCLIWGFLNQLIAEFL